MLRHNTAHTILNVTLNVLLYTGLVFGGIALVLTAKDLITGSNFRPSLTTPITVELSTPDYTYRINEVSASAPLASRWEQIAFISMILGTWMLMLLVLYRAREFFSHLLHDPFDPRNAADLRTATRVALWIQALSIAFQLWRWLHWRPTELTTPLTKALQNVPDLDVKLQSGFHFTVPFGDHLVLFGLDIRPLLLAACLTILATVFQRGHDLREEERRLLRETQQLREDQELTI